MSGSWRGPSCQAVREGDRGGGDHGPVAVPVARWGKTGESPALSRNGDRRAGTGARDRCPVCEAIDPRPGTAASEARVPTPRLRSAPAEGW